MVDRREERGGGGYAAICANNLPNQSCYQSYVGLCSQPAKVDHFKDEKSFWMVKDLCNRPIPSTPSCHKNLRNFNE